MPYNLYRRNYNEFYFKILIKTINNFQEFFLRLKSMKLNDFFY